MTTDKPPEGKRGVALPISSALVSPELRQRLSTEKIIELCEEHRQRREALDNGLYVSFFKDPVTNEYCVIVSEEHCDEFVMARAVEVLKTSEARH